MDIGKGLLYHIDLFFMVGMADIGHMDQYIGFPHLIQCDLNESTRVWEVYV